MKTFFAISMLVVSFGIYAGESPAVATSGIVKGEVQEVLDANGFTYLRLKTKDGEFWASVSKATVIKGAEVSIENVIAMKDFKSKSLNRTFPLLLLGNLPGVAPGSPHAGDGAANPHSGMAKAPESVDVKVAKASGAGARSVAEVVTKSAALKDQPVQVRGKIVKYNQAIMGKNWLHLRDGSGTAADNTNDLLLRTSNAAKLGDVVTAKGVVRTDQDFGSGYACKVLIDDATLTK